VGIKHAWQSAASDGPDATKLQPSKWNADHVGGFDNPMTIGGDLIFANPAGQATDVFDSGPYSGAATAYVIPQITGLTAGVTYTVQFECGSNHTMGWRVDAFPTGGGALVASSSTVYTDNGMGWSTQTLTITLPAGSTEIRIWTGTDWSWHIQNIYVKHAATLPDRLPIGSTGDILKVSGGIPVWAHPSIPTKAGTPTDSDTLSTAADGMMILDTANHRLYIRDGGVWKYATLT
jgi:hypothetical protein